jgi:hypothetical protein
MRNYAVNALNEDDGDIQRNGSRKGGAMTCGGGVVVMMAAVAMTVALCMAVFVMAGTAVFALRVGMTGVIVRNFAAMVVTSVIVRNFVAKVVAGVIVRNMVAMVASGVIVRNIIAMVMAGVIGPAAALLVMARRIVPGQRPHTFTGAHQTLHIIGILTFEPYGRVIVFALLGGAVRAWYGFHHGSGENSVMGSATCSSISVSMLLMCRSAAM